MQKLVYLYARSLLPQQLQRHPGTLQLLMDPGVVRFKLAAAARHRRPIQPPLQLGVVQLPGHRPVDAGRSGLQNDGSDRALGQPQRTAGLRVT
jgi:hypothetical protein